MDAALLSEFKASIQNALSEAPQNTIYSRDELLQSAETRSPMTGDSLDHAQEESDLSLRFDLCDRGFQRIKSLEAAKRRIQDGTYGLCFECEEDIDPRRLKVHSAALLCVSCQIQEEKQAAIYAKGTLERAFRLKGEVPWVLLNVQDVKISVLKCSKPMLTAPAAIIALNLINELSRLFQIGPLSKLIRPFRDFLNKGWIFKERMFQMKNCRLNWMKNELSKRIVWTYFLFPSLAWADFQSSIQSLITGVVTGIFPALVMYEAAKAGVSYAKKSPDAKEKAEAAAIGAIAVLGINGVWSYLKGHVR